MKECLPLFLFPSVVPQKISYAQKLSVNRNMCEESNTRLNFVSFFQTLILGGNEKCIQEKVQFVHISISQMNFILHVRLCIVYTLIGSYTSVYLCGTHTVYSTIYVGPLS